MRTNVVIQMLLSAFFFVASCSDDMGNNRHSAVAGWVVALVSILAMTSLVMFMLSRLRKQRIHDLLVRQQLVAWKMEAVRSRISPHFIFNALNHEMLCQMKGEEVDFSALISLLRLGLDQAEKKCTTLDDELNFIDHYVEIEGRKMGGGLIYEKKIDENVRGEVKQIMLPTMAIQIFVENAFRHGLHPIKDMRQPHLVIAVYRKGDGVNIDVIDNGCGMVGETAPQESVGLSTVRQTIQIFNERNRQPMLFGISNKKDGHDGCISWLFIPDNYKFDL